VGEAWLKTLILSFSTDKCWYPTGTKRFLKLREVSSSIVELYVLYLVWLQFENYFMRPNNFSDSFVFCSRMFCFILQTSECFRWVSLIYNHSVVATVCWNAVTSVKNISSCGPQKSTVIVSFLWPTVRCLLRTDHNKKVKPHVSNAPFSKKQFLEKFISSSPMQNYQTFLKRSYLPSCVAFAGHSLLVFCAVLWNRSCR